MNIDSSYVVYKGYKLGVMTGGNIQQNYHQNVLIKSGTI